LFFPDVDSLFNPYEFQAFKHKENSKIHKMAYDKDKVSNDNRSQQ